MGDIAELSGGAAGDELEQAIAGLDEQAAPGGAKGAAGGNPESTEQDDPLADPNGNAEGEKPESEIKGLTPEAQHALNERINTEVGKRKALEGERDTFKGQVDQLNERLAEMETRLRESRGGDPLDLAESEADINREKAILESYRRELAAIRDGGGEINGQFYEQSAVEAALVKLDAEIAHKIPLARKNMEERRAKADEVKARYPSLFKEGTSANKEAVKLREEIPALKSRKDGWELIAALLLGKRAMEARAKPAAAPAPARTPPPPGPSKTSAPPSSPAGGKSGHQRYSTHTDTPDEDVAEGIARFLEEAGIGPTY